MPIYEFSCPEGHRTEILAPVGAPAPEVCPECAQPLRRVLSAPSIRFCGPGFYSTDYGRGSVSR